MSRILRYGPLGTDSALFLYGVLKPKRDTLFVELQKWDDFLREPNDRLYQPDLVEQLVDVRSELKRIALPEALLQSEVAILPEIFEYFLQLEVLYIIVNAQPDLQSANNDMKVQRRWEIERIQKKAAYLWDNANAGFKSGDSSKYVGNEALHKVLGDTSETLTEELAKNNTRSFEIWPVTARAMWFYVGGDYFFPCWNMGCRIEFIY